MKPIFVILFATALVAPLSAGDPKPGNDLIDLFEKSQREGATDEELMRMLELKAMTELGLDGKPAPERKEAAPGKEARNSPEGDARPRPFLKLPLQNEGFPRWFVGLIVEPIDPALRSHFDLPKDAGVLVESVMPGSPAAEAGIKPNDIIVTANGRNVSSLEALKAEVSKAGSEGKSMNLEVIQRGKKAVLKVTPRGPEAPAAKRDRPDQGAAMRPMMEIQRRLEAQQKEIEALRREIRELRARLEQE